MARQNFISEELRNAFDAFRSSRRYMFLKNLQLGRIVPEECEFPEELGASTLEELVMGGVDSLVQMPLTAVQHDSLLELLRSLSTEEEILSLSSSNDAEDSGSNNQPHVGSIQLELLLRQHLTQITSHDRYSEVRRRAVGEFWDPTWIPAPFEEALRIEQLANMDLAVLFKKRSVSDNRIHILCQALAKVVVLLNQGHPPQTSYPVAVSAPRDELPAEWREVRSDLSIGDKAIIASMRSCFDLPSTARAHAIAHAVVNTLTQSECLSIVHSLWVSPNLMTRVQESLEGSITPELARAITVTLQGPGVRAENIAILLRSCHQEDSVALEVLAIVVMSALGAEPVRHKGKTCPGFWTSNPDLIALLVDKKNSAAGRSALSMDPFLLTWISERQGQKRKGKKYPARSSRKGKVAR